MVLLQAFLLSQAASNNLVLASLCYSKGHDQEPALVYAIEATVEDLTNQRALWVHKYQEIEL